MGYAFTFPIFHFITGGKIPIGAYVHYPTISSDMVARVKERKAGVTNPSNVASSRWRTRGKIM
jgi:alpha-1,2-mannosyltransferase